MAQYLLFNKPYDVLTQFSEGQISKGQTSERQTSEGHETPNKPPPSRATLKDYIPVAGVYPVGRLDRDSEGLLLLTDHGPLQHRLSDPKFGHPRTYWVQVERIPDESAFNQLRCGIEVQDYISRPAKVEPIAEPDLPPRNPPIRYRQQVPTAWIEITLTEGRNRQVRRMTAAVGFPTLRLVRVAIAHLRLDGLAPGQWRFLTEAEVKQLYRMVGLRVP